MQASQQKTKKKPTTNEVQWSACLLFLARRPIRELFRKKLTFGFFFVVSHHRAICIIRIIAGHWHTY